MFLSPARTRPRCPRPQTLCTPPRAATLQDHAMVGALYRPSDPLQEGEVGHVTGADLDDLSMLHNGLDLVGVHHLGDALEAELVVNLGHDPQPLLSEALERIRGGARLEGAAAHVLEARPFNGLCARSVLLVALDRTRAGDHPEGARPDHAVGGLCVCPGALYNVHIYLENSPR